MPRPSPPHARLRRPFHYPQDDDDDDDDDDTSSLPETLDEQEQDSLITHLSAQNALQNHHFTRLLLALPLATTTPYLALFLLPPHHRIQPAEALTAILSITSLLSTAYLLLVLPPTTTGIAPLDGWAERRAGGGSRTSSIQGRLLTSGERLRSSSPLEVYLPYLNGGLVTVLALMGFVPGGASRDSGGFAWIGNGNLPGVVYGVVLLAKVVMGGVDPEGELAPLRYPYKGA